MTRSVSFLIVAAGVTAQIGGATAQTPIPAATRADSLYFAEQWAAARISYDSFLVAHPTATAARLNAGFASLRLAAPDQAIGYFDRVVAQVAGGRAPVALAGLAIAYAAKGDRNRALDRLDSAVAAGFGNFELLDREPDFGSLRSESRFVAARDRAERQVFPCLGDPRHRAFDFWIGEWDAYPNGSTQVAGRSRIERISGGCAILESWTTVATPTKVPYQGKSLNFLDSGTGKWRQVWAGSGRDIGTFDDGELVDGAIRFSYRKTNPQGQPIEGHFIFYNLGPNKVRQFQDRSLDGGKTHHTVIDFIYVRKGSGESPVTPDRG